MKRRKNLERAIVLGLLLSTSVYGSAWAELSNDMHFYRGESPSDTDTTVMDAPKQNLKIIDKSNDGEFDAAILVTSTRPDNGHTYNYNVNYILNSLNIDITKLAEGSTNIANNYYIAGVMVDGLNAKKTANLILTTNEGINVKVDSQNNYAAVGVWAQSDDSIKLNSKNGDVTVNVTKTAGSNLSYKDVGEEDRTLHAVYGLNASNDRNAASYDPNDESNGSEINITTDNGSISVTAKTESTDLTGSHVYAAANDNGNIILNAANEICLEAYANNTNNAYGLDTWGGKENKVESEQINVYAEAVDGDAYGIKVDNGSIENRFEAGQSNIIEANSKNGNAYGVFVNNGSALNIASDENNYINAYVENYDKDSESIAIKADGKGSIVLVSGKETYINSNEDGFYDKSIKGLAVSAEQSAYVDIKAEIGGINNIGGAVSAKDTHTVVNIIGKDSSVENNIHSAAVIENAGDLQNSKDEDMKDLKVVAALYAEDGATINLSGTNIISTYYSDPNDKTTSERVIWAYNNGDINIDGYTNISTSKYADSPLNKDIAIAAGTATNLADESFGGNYPAQDEWANVNVTYNDYGELHSSITGDILAAYAGNVDIKAVQDSDAGLDVHGDLLSGNGGTLSVDFGNGGTWTGRGDSYIDAGTADDYKNHQNFYSPAFSSDIITGGDIEVTMNNGTWHVTGQSWINTFKANDTEIYMTDEDNVTNAVTINEMNGNGNTFYMNLDNNDRIGSDMLYIKDGGENGATFDVVVTGVINGLSNVTEEDGLRFATVGSGINLEQISLDGYGIIKGVDGGAFNTNLYVKREAYDVNNSHNDEFNGEGFTQHKPGSSTVEDMFGLTQEQEENPEIMMLAAESQENDNTATVNSLADTLSIVRATQDGLSDAGKTMLNMSRANYSNAIYMDRLNKRLGEVRYINGEENEGMWVRIRHDRIGKTDAYRSQNTMYELGYDVKQECDNGERRIGFAVDYMHGDTGYSDVAGKGELDRYGLWLYDTWMGDKGHYVDYVAKWGHLDNDFEVYTMSEGKKVTGDYSNNVFSVSAEYGRKKDIGSDWYFEPQAQVQLARVTGADYTTSQGTKVSVDGINSLIGRAGFRIGKDFGEQKQSTVYIKADVLHEFLGDQDVSVMDDTTNGRYVGIGYENEGTWYDVGFGFATQTGKNSYAFMDFEKSFGHDNDETYQINAGIQWTF